MPRMGKTGIGPDQALQKLMDGNRRFGENRMTLPKSSGAPAREKLVKGQSPYAIALIKDASEPGTTATVAG